MEYIYRIKHWVRDNRVIGIDYGFPKDESCYVYAKTPGRFRKLLRKLKLDQSIWEYKVTKVEYL